MHPILEILLIMQEMSPPILMKFPSVKKPRLSLVKCLIMILLLLPSAVDGPPDKGSINSICFSYFKSAT
jgi:hypothetical protein